MLSKNRNKCRVDIIYVCIYIMVISTQIVFGDSQLSNIKLFSEIPYVFEFLSIIMNLVIFIFGNKFSRHIIPLSLVIIWCFIYAISILITPIINLGLFSTGLFIANISIINFHKFIKKDLVTRIFSISVIFILYILKFLPASNHPYAINHDNTAFRYSLGFNQPNNLGVIILVLLISDFLWSQQLTKYKYFINIIISFIVYLFVLEFSDSREFGIGGFIIILSMIFDKFHWWLPLFKCLAIPSLMASLILFFYISYHLNPNSSFYIFLNSLLSDRLNFQSQVMNIYPPKLTGYKHLMLITSMGEQIPTDNLYEVTLLNNGVIGLIVYEMILISLPILAFKLKNNIINVLIVLVSFCAFASGGAMGMYSILFLLFAYLCQCNSNMKNRKANS